MAQHDLIVSFLSSVPPAVLKMFKTRPLQAVCPTGQYPVVDGSGKKWPGGREGYFLWLSQYLGPDGGYIRGLARYAGAKPGDTIGHVAIMGFSNGCLGVMQMLRASDSAKIDVVLALDGIHGAYSGATGKLEASAYKPMLNRAMQSAMSNPFKEEVGSITVITHTAIIPPGFPSTTESSNLIYDLVSSKAPADAQNISKCELGICVDTQMPVVYLMQFNATAKVCGSRVVGQDKVTGKPIVDSVCTEWNGLNDGWSDKRGINRFFVLGWGDLRDGKIKTRDLAGTNDHIHQGRDVLPALLEVFCVRRWEEHCDPVVNVDGALVREGSKCYLASGVIFENSNAQKTDYFPEVPDGGGGGGGGGNGGGGGEPYKPPEPEVVEKEASYLPVVVGFAGGLLTVYLLTKAYRRS